MKKLVISAIVLSIFLSIRPGFGLINTKSETVPKEPGQQWFICIYRPFSPIGMLGDLIILTNGVKLTSLSVNKYYLFTYDHDSINIEGTDSMKFSKLAFSLKLKSDTTNFIRTGYTMLPPYLEFEEIPYERGIKEAPLPNKNEKLSGEKSNSSTGKKDSGDFPVYLRAYGGYGLFPLALVLSYPGSFTGGGSLLFGKSGEWGAGVDVSYLPILSYKSSTNSVSLNAIPVLAVLSMGFFDFGIGASYITGIMEGYFSDLKIMLNKYYFTMSLGLNYYFDLGGRIKPFIGLNVINIFGEGFSADMAFVIRLGICL